MDDEEMSCGHELAASAEVPDAIGALMNHVASNLDAHADWVGSASDAAEREQEAMNRVASEYRSIAAAAANAATVMRSFAELKPAAHDPAAFDRPAFVEWMRAKIELQRALANMLLRHAEMSEKALAATDSAGRPDTR
jgi:hypothetical protein